MHYYIGKRTNLPIVGNVHHGFSFYISKHVTEVFCTIIGLIGLPILIAIGFFINHFVVVTSVILLIALVAASIKQSLNGYTLKEWIADRLLNDDEEPKQKKEAPADYYKYSKQVFNFNGNNDSFMKF